MKVVLLAVIALSISARAQDPASTAMQQTQQAAQQATDQAQRDAQAANQAAQQASQQNTDQAQNGTAATRQPQFSHTSGRTDPGTQVRISSPTHYATIYYTTNGWTPTPASLRYTGPITVDRDMEIQAIAIAPNHTPSSVARVQFSVPGGSKNLPASLSTDGILHAGTAIRLATASDVNSKTAHVGDKIALRLDEDITEGDRILIAKGAPLDGLITHADHAGHVGVPGDIVFEVRSLQANGVLIPLRGGETLEGFSHARRAAGFLMIPLIGGAGMLTKGEEAFIKPGMTFNVTVESDTPLNPSSRN